MHRWGSVDGLDVAGRVLALAEQKLNIILATCSNQFWLWRGWSATISAEKAASTAPASVRSRPNPTDLNSELLSYFPQRCMLTSRLKLLYSFQ